MSIGIVRTARVSADLWGWDNLVTWLCGRKTCVKSIEIAWGASHPPPGEVVSVSDIRPNTPYIYL